MAGRKKMSEAARQFIRTGQVHPSSPPSASSDQPTSNSLGQELLGDEQATESSVRFTVDLPRSLHRRLDQLSTDSGKPKTELVRIMIRRALENIDY